MSYTVQPHQNSSVYPNLKTEIITVPFQNNTSFGGYSTVLFNEINLKVHQIELQFVCSAISGLTGTPDAGFPNLNPACHWISRIELVMQNTTVDTVYGDELFLLNQIMLDDSQRIKRNISMGDYASNTIRAATNAKNNQIYNVVIPSSLFSQAHPSLLTSASNFQLRVYMNSLSNVINQGTLTGTPVFNILQTNLIARITRLPASMASSELMALSKKSIGYLFNQTRYATFTVQSGAQQVNLVLSAITGNISSIMFVCRPTTGLTNLNQWNFLPVLNFSYLDAGSTNVVGGLPISSDFSLLQQGEWNTASSFLTESYTGISNSNVYIYSFSMDCIENLKTGKRLSCRNFVGNETLQILFSSALSSTTQVDVWAFCDQTAVFSPNSVVNTN